MSLTRLPHKNLAAEYISVQIVHIIGAFPRMMLRQQTFPPFIHPYWHWPALPETLANCMSIAQLFDSRTPDTSPFLWRVVDAEEQRFREGMDTMSAYEAQWVVQALMIYIIMVIVDRESRKVGRGRRMLETLGVRLLAGYDLLRLMCLGISNPAS